MSAAPMAPPARSLARGTTLSTIVRRNGWNVALLLLLGAMLATAKLIRTDYGPTDLQSLATAVLPVAFWSTPESSIVAPLSYTKT